MGKREDYLLKEVYFLQSLVTTLVNMNERLLNRIDGVVSVEEKIISNEDLEKKQSLIDNHLRQIMGEDYEETGLVNKGQSGASEAN